MASRVICFVLLMHCSVLACISCDAEARLCGRDTEAMLDHDEQESFLQLGSHQEKGVRAHAAKAKASAPTLEAPWTVNAKSALEPQVVSLIQDDSGRALSPPRLALCWARSSPADDDNSNVDVFVGIFEYDGTPVVSSIQVNTQHQHNQQRCSLAALNNGHFAVTWGSEDIDQTNRDDQVRHVFTRVLDKDGNFTSGPVDVQVHDGKLKLNKGFRPSTVALESAEGCNRQTKPSGDYLVVWANNREDDDSLNTERRLSFRRLSQSGEFLTEEQRVELTWTDMPQTLSYDAASLPCGGAVVVGGFEDGPVINGPREVAPGIFVDLPVARNASIQGSVLLADLSKQFGFKIDVQCGPAVCFRSVSVRTISNDPPLFVVVWNMVQRMDISPAADLLQAQVFAVTETDISSAVVTPVSEIETLRITNIENKFQFALSAARDHSTGKYGKPRASSEFTIISTAHCQTLNENDWRVDACTEEHFDISIAAYKFSGGAKAGSQIESSWDPRDHNITDGSGNLEPITKVEFKPADVAYVHNGQANDIVVTFVHPCTIDGSEAGCISARKVERK